MDFWAQARADLSTATTLLDAGIHYASVFFSHQAAEQALKAATLEHLHRLPGGHNLIALANELQAPLEIMDAAAELNPEFTLTRSPDTVDDVPARLYDAEIARRRLASARRLIAWARSLR